MKKRAMKHYKPARYKVHKKPVNKTAVLIILAVLIMIGLSIALGAYLNTVSAPNHTPSDTQGLQGGDPYKVYDAYEKLGVERRSFLPLDGYAYLSDDDAETAILRANGALVHALCINLLDADGAPSYKSGYYNKTYSAKSGEIDLSLLLSRFKKNGISVTAYFELYSLSEGYREMSEERMRLELGIISEAYSAGLRDITLFPVERADADELYGFVSRIKSACPDMAVGICAEAELLLSDTVYTAKLDDIFDYIAIDLTKELEAAIAGTKPSADSDTGADSEAVSFAEPDREAWASAAAEAFADTAGASLVTAERFEARMLVRTGDGCGICQDTATKAFSALGAESFMLVRAKCPH